ncbi:MAG: carbohydrate ABC transporter permease, partial [Atribacterota bacterium]|nr:carbohydrate ABC transporter permease [Atribacterota bacterium]
MDKLWKKSGVAFLFVVIIIQLIPFYITLTTSVKAKIDLSSKWQIPSSIYWENFKVAIERGLILKDRK